jgi:hypothetical protein
MQISYIDQQDFFCIILLKDLNTFPYIGFHLEYSSILVTLIGLQSWHTRPLQHTTILKMKSDNCRVLQKLHKAIAL